MKEKLRKLELEAVVYERGSDEMQRGFRDL